jgi:hypothetical protein
MAVQDLDSTQSLGKPKHVFFEPHPSYMSSVTTEACGGEKKVNFNYSPKMVTVSTSTNLKLLFLTVMFD